MANYTSRNSDNKRNKYFHVVHLLPYQYRRRQRKDYIIPILHFPSFSSIFYETPQTHRTVRLARELNQKGYSENAIAEKEYVIERTKLVEKLDDLNDEIGIMQTDEWQEALSDETFIAKASEFIIAQKLSDRAYINFRRLASTVDAGVPAFVLYQHN